MLQFNLMESFKAFGKFLITAEYLVLYGASGLAIPLTKKYQTLNVLKGFNSKISWTAFDQDNEIWFECTFNSATLEIIETSNFSNAITLQLILKEARLLNPELLNGISAFVTHMNFSPTWGMGSSSTLISLISQWANLNAYHLQKKIFKGSGYDVACATSASSILYQLEDNLPKVDIVQWSPSYKDNLYFIYLGRKQSTLNEIQKLRQSSKLVIEMADILRINQITKSIVECGSLNVFQNLLIEHESIISKYSGMKPVKNLIFPDIDGEVKSLGAWGGDFVLAACNSDPREYLSKKGHFPVLKWSDLIF